MGILSFIKHKMLRMPTPDAQLKELEARHQQSVLTLNELKGEAIALTVLYGTLPPDEEDSIKLLESILALHETLRRYEATVNQTTAMLQVIRTTAGTISSFERSAKR